MKSQGITVGRQAVTIGSPGLLFAVKRGLKWVLGLLTSLLPAKYSKAVLDLMFRLYKRAILIWYSSVYRSFVRVFARDKIEMVEAIRAVLPHTLVGIGGLEATYRIARELNHKGIAGVFVELGVARGGCAALMGRLAFEEGAPRRELFLFDSFEGLPEPSKEDFIGQETGEHVRVLSKGSCLGTLTEVRRLLLDEIHLPKDRVHFVKGWFEDTLQSESARIGEIALLRIDVDWHDSTMLCLQRFYDKVGSGGAVVIDDYFSCHGCSRAVDKFLSERNISANLIPDGRGGCYFWKE